MVIDGMRISNVSGSADKAGMILCASGQCRGLHMEDVHIRVSPGAQQNSGGRIGVPPPEKNEPVLVLPIEMGCTDAVPFVREPKTPF